MKFTSGINRPPYEMSDGYLQVTEGCSHNSCFFCTYFKDTKYRNSLIEEIEADIKEIPENFGTPKRIFLQGADAFSAEYDVLMKTAELLHKYVPSVQSIGGYARIDSFYNKSVEQLRAMKEAGFENPYIGVESGDDKVLKMINKGYTAVQAREQLEKIDMSEMPYIVNFLNGAGGHEYGLGNAQKTAKLYDGLHPTMVNMSMMTVVPNTPLHRMIEKGMYMESTEKEKLEEAQEFIRCLTNNTIYMTEHASNQFHVKCSLPEEKDALINHIQKLIDGRDENELRRYREMITRAF